MGEILPVEFTETGKFEQFLKMHPGKICWHGSEGLDIGYGSGETKPFQGFTGFDQDHPQFNSSGKLPYADSSFDIVYSSNCLEHIVDHRWTIKEWFRVVKTGGFMILLVPHKFLYEKKRSPPSNFNPEHYRFYTPASLMAEIEGALNANTYRLVDMYDCDYGFDYSIPAEKHSVGNYSIVCVIRKIIRPEWGLL